MSIYVTELRCPHCQTALGGLSEDVAFVCDNCHRAVEMRTGRFASVKTHLAPPSLETTLPRLQLPFWRFPIEAGVVAQDQSDWTHRFGLNALDDVWVAGFREVRPAYLGNPGYDFTTACITPLIATFPDRLVCRGTSRSSEDARQYVPVFVRTMADRQRDISDFHVSVVIGDPDLWWLPFAFNLEENIISCLITGRAYKSAILDQYRRPD